MTRWAREGDGERASLPPHTGGCDMQFTRMMTQRLTIGLCLFALGTAAAVDASPTTTTAILHATVVHPERAPGEAIAKDQTIVIEGERIRSVGPSARAVVPRGAQVFDARGKWITPGLIDAHVHFFQSGNLYTRPDVADLTRARPYAEEFARNKERLPATFRIWLASGVTGVVDIGGPFWNYEVRDLARRSDAAPRVGVAGPLISMVSRPEPDLGDPPIVEIHTPEEARALVARELERKPDYVKVWFIHRPSDDLQAQTAIVRATAEAAHAAHVPLAVHATELLVAKESLRAGADYLVHSVFDEPVDDEFITLLKERKALYCPTLFVYNGYQYALSNRWVPTDVERERDDPRILAEMSDLDRIPAELIHERVRKAMEAKQLVLPTAIGLANLRALSMAGVPIVMGTDAGNIGTLHGPSIFREMDYMQRAGLTPLEVLRSATTTGARALRMPDDLGAVAPGKLADLLVLDADPLVDSANLSRIHRVVKNGVVYDPRELMEAVR